MVLLDTCTLLWLASDQKALSEKARDTIRRHADALFVSAISAFEIAVKQRSGKLELPLDPVTWFQRALRSHGIHEIPINSLIAGRSVRLPRHHNDPCDRLIIATALHTAMPILTPDALIARYKEVQAIW